MALDTAGITQKGSVSAVPGQGNAMAAQHMELYTFLANHETLTASLKDQLKTVEGCDEVLTDVIHACTLAIEQGCSLIPKERFAIIEVCRRAFRY